MVAGNWGISTLRPEHQKCQRGKRRVIQRAIEEGNDETERDLGRNDGQRDLEKLYNALEENGLVMRTNMDGTQISPILLDLLKKLRRST